MLVLWTVLEEHRIFVGIVKVYIGYDDEFVGISKHNNNSI